MPKTIALLSLLGLLVSSAGQAQVFDPDLAEVYVGVTGAYAWMVRADDEFSGSGISNDIDPSFGVALTYGVRFAEHVSIEVDFEWFEGHDVDQRSPLSSVDDKLTTYSLSSSIAYRPFFGRVDPFISIGLGWMRAELRDFDADGDGMALRVALGSDFWLTRHIGLRISGRYMFPVTSEIEDLDTISPQVGVFYRF